MSLFPYQEKHQEALVQALSAHKCVVDASDTGTGKTYVAADIAKQLGLKPVIICPKAVIMVWKRVMESFGVEYLGISNYEMMKGGTWYSYDDSHGDSMGKQEKCGLVKYKDKQYTWTGVTDKVLFIFDEAHRCKNKTTVNSRLLLSLQDVDCKIMLLSATLADKPKFFAVFGTILGLIDNVEEHRLFLKRLKFGGAKDSKSYWAKSATAKPDMYNLHQIIFPEYGSRMKIKDLKDVFPDNRIVADTYVMDDDTVAEIKKQYEYISLVHTEAQAKEEEAVCILAIMIRARQKIEALKVKTMLELIEDHVQNGNSVAVFVNYLDTMALLQDKLGVKCVIRGGQTVQERQKHIDDFNNDRERIIIAQIQSGGVGISLHDTIGDHPRVSIISPSWSAQDLMQTFGRIHRAKGKTPCIQKLVYCHGTIEEDICKIVNAKLVNYALLNDGGVQSAQTPA